MRLESFARAWQEAAGVEAVAARLQLGAEAALQYAHACRLAGVNLKCLPDECEWPWHWRSVPSRN